MNFGNKRKDLTQGDNKPKRMKKECDYGEKCYRRNPAHLREFSHKHLESILDGYSGTGDYPIPEKYILERLAIMEQLDIIVEKGIYTPWKNGTDCSTSQNRTLKTPSNTQNPTFTDSKSPKNQPSSSNTLSSLGPGTSYQRNASINPNSIMSSQDTGPSSQQTAINSHKTGPSSQQTGMSSQKTGMSSQQTGMSSQNTGLSSQNTKNNSSKDDVEMKTNSQTSDSSNRSSKDGIIKAGDNNMDYKKAHDYRPVVKPTRKAEDYFKVVRPKGQMASKHATTAPYHIFYTTITDSKETHTQPYSITFLEILDHSLGELKCSLQINFMVELGWLLAQYYFAGYGEKKMTILYGEDGDDLRNISKKKPHIDAHKVSMATPFGTHHTKIMVLCYEDGSLRVVISTANLYIDDWENRTQGLWFSPRCPELPADAMPHDGESPTQFKRSLLRYLANYHMPSLAFYIERVKRCDFSHINVFLVASVPGSHSDTEWGLKRAGALLRQHCAIPGGEGREWPLVAQASSLGSYGARPELWLTGDFLHHFTKIKEQPQTLCAPPELKLVYPSLENVKQSHDGLLGGGCLPYGAAVHSKQPWLIDFLYQWVSRDAARHRAMPHVKSYCRVSRDNARAAYFLLTSANCSKAAWGTVNKGNANLRIMSYEAGVMFLPKFVIDKDFFPIGEGGLILPYDVPPVKYSKDMSPWVMDYLQ